MESLESMMLKFAAKDSAHGIFVSGTDTGVGKTHVSRVLVQKILKAGIPALGFKPICAGDREDALKYWHLFQRKISLDIINPVHLPLPLAPVAQKCPPWPILLKKIRKAVHLLKTCHGNPFLVVEGAGGILCPITNQKTMRDLAAAFDFPLILVVPNRLGVLNHTLLSIEAAQRKNLSILGIVMNNTPKFGGDFSRQSNLKILKRLTKIPLYSF